jgi:hypothetical protein
VVAETGSGVFEEDQCPAAFPDPNFDELGLVLG